MLKCPFCPCEFSCQVDLDIHLAAWGKRGHRLKFQKLHDDDENDYERLHGGADRVVWQIRQLVLYGRGW